MSRIAEALVGGAYGYPVSPGSKEKGGTSEDAAAGVEGKTARLRRQCLARVREVPSTADEVAEHLGEEIWTIRPRLSELGKMGLIVKSGDRRRNRSGADAWVWRAVSP